MNSDQFRCAACGEVFDKAMSEEEAEAQLAEEFPGFDKSDCDLVCEDCYKLMGFT